ncbi:MAG: alpha/beta hydrolase [Chloroflexi bacterium]|nr:alpha/beta hydrolase [Chloroflexota bacterium]MDA1270881.1 alpha/beta hydrolase [Chloroflexota bacterium]
MTDYLLVHGAGQGAWSWGPVWGRLTAPEDNPPTLHKRRRANRVHPLDLPGHGADAGGDTSAVRLEECVQSITRAVDREGLKDLVLVGHGFAGSLVLQAAREMKAAPKRVVLVAGIVPPPQRSILSACSRKVRTVFGILSALSSLSRQELKLPRPAISGYLCNGMDPMAVVQLVGFFGPLPTRVLKSRSTMEDSELPCPVTYVVLTQDKMVPPDSQRRMAERLEGVEMVEIDSCHQVMAQHPEELADVLLLYA